jgi:hypothetical protein
MVPGLKMLFGGEDTTQVTALLKLPVPETTGVNCCWVPMIAVAGLGITETEEIVGPVGVVVVEPASPPPQPATKRLKPVTIQPAACQPKFFIPKAPDQLARRAKPYRHHLHSRFNPVQSYSAAAVKLLEGPALTDQPAFALIR